MNERCPECGSWVRPCPAGEKWIPARRVLGGVCWWHLLAFIGFSKAVFEAAAAGDRANVVAGLEYVREGMKP